MSQYTKYPAVGGGGGGTVTSVGLSAPAALFTVAGSPVVSSGTLTLSLIAASSNFVFAGPTAGPAAAPTFRLLDALDLPTFTASRVVVTSPTGVIGASTTTTTQLSFLDATSSIQTQLNGKVGSVGAFSGTGVAAGLDISGTVLSLHAADATNPGAVSTGTQTLAGAKTFTGDTLIANNTASVATIGGTSSSAVHIVNGGLRVTTRTITGNLVIDAGTSDYIVFCNQAAAVSITLPTPTVGRTVSIKDISGNAMTNNITVLRSGSESIEGVAASKVFSTNYGAWSLTSDGTNWWMT